MRKVRNDGARMGEGGDEVRRGGCRRARGRGEAIGGGAGAGRGGRGPC